MKNEAVVEGTKYRSKNGLVGTVTNINGVLRLAVRSGSNKITQTINLKDIHLKKFEKVD